MSEAPPRHGVRAMVRAWWVRFVALFDGERGRARKDNELAAELEAHLQMHIEDNVRRGMTPEAARRDALMQLGGLDQTKENVRERRGLLLLESLLQDIRFGLRMLRKSPGFTTVAILTLALGIGATTAIFTVVESVLLRPLPYPHAEQIVKVGSTYKGSPYSEAVIAGPHYRFLQQFSRSFDAVEAHDVVTSGVNVSGGSEPEHVVSAAVSAGFFNVLGVGPAIGRAFTEAEDRPGAPCVAVLTDGLWRRRYAGDPAIVGTRMDINGQSCAVTGVLPATFRFDQPAEIFMPVRIPGVTNDLGHSYFMLARLRPGVSFEQARAEMQTLFARFKVAHGDLVSNDETGIELEPYLDSIVGTVRPGLWALFGSVSLLLLIACANVASLLLSRSVGRRGEMALRAALGGERKRLTRQLIAENAVLACIGGGLGFLLAKWALPVLRSISSGIVPRTADISIDLRVIGFTLFLSALTVLLFGLAPAVRASGADILHLLQATSGRTGTDAGHIRARKLLIGIEVALSVVLLAGAVLLMRSFVALRNIAPGFNAASVLTFKMSPLPRYSTTALLWGFEGRVLERLRSLPGVEAASVAICLPLEVGPDMPTQILGQPQADTISPHYRTVSPDYFRTFEIPILKGRSFSYSDVSGATPVVIINESMARRFFKNGDALSEHLLLGVGLGADYVDPPREIVGIVGDVRESNPEQLAGWTVFIPRAQVPSALTAPINRLVGTSWAVKTNIPPAQLADAAGASVLSIDPQQPVSGMRTMKEAMSAAVERQRFTVLLMVLFANLGVLLAAVGIYGVISYVVAQRTHEIGIRTALGAKRSDVLKLAILEGLKPTLAGLAVGIAGALALTRFLSSQLFGVKPTDPLTFFAVTLILIIVALLACYVPARRATKVDPMVALRYE